MRRRDVLTLFAGTATAWSSPARAAEKPARLIGFLSSLSRSAPFAEAFRRGLSEAGYVDGRDILIEYRWIEDSYEKLPGMAADFVERGAVLIGALFWLPKQRPPTSRSSSSQARTQSNSGSISSFNHPGGYLTGVWLVTSTLAQKRLELIREMVPQASVIALLVNPRSPVADAQAGADALGLKLAIVKAVAEGEFKAAFDQLADAKTDALLVGADPLFASRQDVLSRLAAEHRIPAIINDANLLKRG
jgi:putative ABC transport system substrate-binding protein